MRASTILLALSLFPMSCRTSPAPESMTPTPPPPSSPAWNDEIVACGQRFHTGAPVVLWTEPPYYDASKAEPRFGAPADPAKAPKGLRYRPGRVQRIPNPTYKPPPLEGDDDERSEVEKYLELEEPLVPEGTRDLDALREAVDQFVLHYDVCGISRTCFKVLQDQRGLSVHFLLDVDGTIYQTLDLRDTAWHATKSNSRSVGIEIASMGAYPLTEAWKLDAWYGRDAAGSHISIPATIHETGVRTPGFVGRPARDARVQGEIQGKTLEQYDFTPEQYDSLVKLAATLCAVFPKIEPDAPRGFDGEVVGRVLDDATWKNFRGILGHYHVQKEKVDPGPAFDWERFLDSVRARMDEVAAQVR
jgi:N-acetyl-anhydromuramyl-L-alanine amidase AmpD